MMESLEYRLLDPWIIEKIKPEEEEKRDSERPSIQPYAPVYEPSQSKPDSGKPKRGVVKIDINGDDEDDNPYVTVIRI